MSGSLACGQRWGAQLGFAVSDGIERMPLIPELSAGVLGCMPNIPANRLNSQLDSRERVEPFLRKSI